MGATFSSIQVRADSQKAVIEGLNGLLKEPTYVSPAIGGWVGVYPEEGRVATEELAAQVSERTTLPVFAWQAYDSDVFFYHLYEDGKLRDEFNSNPHFFEGQVAEGDEGKQERIDPIQVQGDPQALLPFCTPGTTVTAISEVLHPPLSPEIPGDVSMPSPYFPEKSLDQFARMLNTTVETVKQGIAQKSREKYTFAEEQAADLAKLLGMDESLASAGFRYIEQGDIENYANEDFRLIGNENLSQEYKDNKLKGVSLQVEHLRPVIEAGANVNLRNSSGEPFLLKAVRYCAAEAVGVLVEAGAEVNAATTASPNLQWGYGYEAGVTALMVAAGASTERPDSLAETVRILLDAGADVNARSETGRTALGEALKMTDPTQHQGKIGRHAPEEVLRQAAARSAQVVEMLRAAGATE